MLETELLGDEVDILPLCRRERPRKGQLVTKRVVLEDEDARVDLESLRVVKVEFCSRVASVRNGDSREGRLAAPCRCPTSLPLALFDLAILALIDVPTSLGGLWL